MRCLGRAALAVLLATPLGCSRSTPAPTPAPGVTPEPGGSNHPAPPATIVYTVGSLGTRVLMSVLEDGSAAPRMLSNANADTTFVAELAGRRVLGVEHTGDGQSVSRLIIVSLDGSSPRTLALPTGYYAASKALVMDEDAVAVELFKTGTGGGTDVYVARPDGATLLSEQATLVTVASGRVAYLTCGNLRSIRTDGTGELALGDGNCHDVVAQAAGDLVLFSSESEARLARIDGLATVTLGNAEAFALTSGGRIVYTRDSAIFASSLDGTDEHALGAGSPVAVAPDGRVLATNAAGALLSLGTTGGDSRVLDPQAGSMLRFVRIFGDRAVYTGETTDSVALRTARLDGGGSAQIYRDDVTLPVATGISPEGRVVFHIALVGQLEGGQVLSAKLDGSDLMRVGSDVYDETGARRLAEPADQDFEAITPSGRLIVEVEYEGNLFGSQLLATTSASPLARSVSEFGLVRFVALIL